MADGSGVYLLDRLDGLTTELGMTAFTSGNKSTIDMFFITAALMAGTAGLPHVIVRFFTVPRVRDARISAGYALVFIALLYTTAPAVAAFARINIINNVDSMVYADAPEWFRKWENTGLIAWADKNGDGKVQYRGGNALSPAAPAYDGRGEHGERRVSNQLSDNDNELYVDRDIIVLAHPEIAGLPNWVIALVAAGGLAAALSTAAGLLLVISTAISHDLLKKTLMPSISERQELLFARISAAVAIGIAGLFGIYPLGFVAQVVAFAFGLAAASFFPVILLGIFWKRMNKEAAIAGMLTGLTFTFAYIVYFKFVSPDSNNAENWLFGISPEGIGTLGMILNFVVSGVVANVTPPPPPEIQEMVENIRIPRAI
jgi:cation/acetate symporter